MNYLKVLGTLIVLSLPGVAWACGGFFSPDSPMLQNAERIIFTVNGDETITAIMGISYEGEASEFSWLLPVPSIPQMAVAETISLDELQEATNPEFITPRNLCMGLTSFEEGGGGGDGDGGVLMSQVGPYDYTILGGDTGLDVLAWLKENGYNVPQQAEPIIQDYLAMGMYFVAMRLKPDAMVWDIQPVKITFKATQPMIPIRLASIAAAEFVPIYAWIFADVPYQAANYANVSPDFSTMSGLQGGAALGDARLIRSRVRPLLAYDQMRRDLAAPYEGQAFITEYQGDPSNLPMQALRDPLLTDLTERFSVVTRLRAELTPEQMTKDIMFEPAPDLAPVSNHILLGRHIANPLDYWGCHNEDILSEAEKALLPAASSRIKELDLQLHHPDGWTLQHFQVPGQGEDAPEKQDIWAIAPETLTAEQVVSLAEGETLSFPVLLVYPSVEGYLRSHPIWQALESQGIEMALLSRLIQPPTPWSVYYQQEADTAYKGILVSLIASPKDRQANLGTYSAIIADAVSYRAYVAEDLPHTLFLTADASEQWADGTYTFVGYPENWSATMEEGNVIITPQDSTNGARILLIPIPYDLRNGVDGDGDQIPAYAAARYGVSDATEWGRLTTDCYESLSIPFEKDGRTGFVSIGSSYWIEVSAPIGEADEDLLRHLSESIISQHFCG